MAFTDAAGNFTEAWATETTITFLRNLTFATRMNAAYNGDAENAISVFAQNPTLPSTVTRPARKANWSEPQEGSATRIEIEMNKPIRGEYMLYVEDEIENAVGDYRSRYEQSVLHAMSKDWEEQIVAYILGLKTSGGGSANKNAGAVGAISKGKAGVGFDHDTGRPGGSGAAGLPLELLEEVQVALFRADISNYGDNQTIGGTPGSFWCIMPIEIYRFGLAKELESTGISLEFMRQTMQNARIFNGPQWGGNWNGFDLYVSNSLAKPGDTTATDSSEVWNMVFGHDAAIAAPLRRMRNYITLPENAKAERTEFRHQTTGGIQLINSKGVYIASIQSI